MTSRTYLTTTKDGHLVHVLDNGTVSVIKLSMDGNTLTETINGNCKVLVDNDQLVAQAAYDTLASEASRRSHNREYPPIIRNFFSLSRQSEDLESNDGPDRITSFLGGLLIGGIIAAIVAAIFYGSLDSPKTVSEPAVLQRPSISMPPPPYEPVINPPTQTLSIEEINAAKGPQLPPANTEPPVQPNIDLPSTLQVTPDSELTPAANVPVDGTAAQPENPADQAPSATDAEPAAEDISDAGDIFGDRLDENQALLEAIQNNARADVAAGGADTAMEQIEQMRTAVEMLRSGQKLSPEFVAALPPEVATAMRERGLILTPEEAVAAANATSAAPPISIVRLPASVIDRHRDADGIPDIPESNSWLAIGASGPAIPLPGSGEIRTPEDLGRFGLQY